MWLRSHCCYSRISQLAGQAGWDFGDRTIFSFVANRLIVLVFLRVWWVLFPITQSNPFMMMKAWTCNVPRDMWAFLGPRMPCIMMMTRPTNMSGYAAMAQAYSAPWNIERFHVATRVLSSVLSKKGYIYYRYIYIHIPSISMVYPNFRFSTLQL